MTVSSEYRRAVKRAGLAGAMAAAALLVVAPAVMAQADPRVGLRAGYMDAAEAIRGMEKVASKPRPQGFHNPSNPGDFGFANSDLAFRGDHVFIGNFNGFQIYDVSNPANPTLVTSVVCPGGQGDLSVYGNLLFMSVEEPRGRVDCGGQGVSAAVSAERFRGVRIFDISNLASPRQVAAVQTCRGSHTHTLVTDPRDSEHVYAYVSGAAGVRPEAELAGCTAVSPEQDPNTALFRIEVIRVPLRSPQDARVVSEPRIFADAATGAVGGLWAGGDHGPGTQRTAQTNHCHDITAYPELGLAAGACSGNGILLDIRDPANPVRIDEVVDPNFAYWHSATFSNDGRTVIFTDEWGGGTAPRCRATDLPEWGANSLYHLEDGKLKHAGYYKLPAAQTATENCVAHNGSLVPVPGRDIKVQAWYQGGISVFDFTDPANAVEIAFFDRGPISETELMLGGYWSAYWYNGLVYGAEIARGLDIFRLTPSEHLSENEIRAAEMVRWDEFNPQLQPKIEWPANAVVGKAYIDQLVRSGAMPQARGASLAAELDRAEQAPHGAQHAAAVAQFGARVGELEAEARQHAASRAADARRLESLAGVFRAMSHAGH
jgi:hypothetical protein